MTVPTLDRAHAALREAEAERSFWEQHAVELLRRFPDQFVAVRDGEVVASGAELPDLIAQLKAKGISPSGLWIRFLATDPRRLLL
jgi:predicted N-acetyltransferase YhbS